MGQTEDDPLYQTERWFPVDPAGYKIPLPPGRYRMTLHFAEIFFREAGIRVFDVLVEEKVVLPGHDPCRVGFAVASRHAVDIVVRDGFLDLQLLRRIDAPKLSAIEIEPID